MPTTSPAFATVTVLLNLALVGVVLLVLLRRRARPVAPTRLDRIGWQVYLNDLPNPCEDGHTRLFLTGPSPETSGVLCAVCTTELERPDWMDCGSCHWFPVDGHLHVAHCGTHVERDADPQQEVA